MINRLHISHWGHNILTCSFQDLGANRPRAKGAEHVLSSSTSVPTVTPRLTMHLHCSYSPPEEKGCHDCSHTNLVGSKAAAPNLWEESPKWMEAASIRDHPTVPHSYSQTRKTQWILDSKTMKCPVPFHKTCSLSPIEYTIVVIKLFCFHFERHSLILYFVCAKIRDNAFQANNII